MIPTPLSVKDFYNKYLTLDINKNFFDSFKFSHALIDGEDFVFFEKTTHNEIIGLIAFSVKDNVLYNLFVEVLPLHQQKGIGTNLLKLQFAFAKMNQLIIQNSKYSTLGQNRLAKYHQLFSKEFNISLKEFNSQLNLF